jgi:hypothetical protein
MSFTFDRDDAEKELAEHGEDGDFGIVPAGWYTAVIQRAEAKETKKKKEGQTDKGLMWAFGFQLAGNEQYDGRFVWCNINVENDNDVAVRIGLKHLTALSRATDCARMEGPEDIVGQTVDIKVSIEKGTGNFEDRNSVKDFAPEGAGQKSGGKPNAFTAKAKPAKKKAKAKKKAEVSAEGDAEASAEGGAEDAPKKKKTPWGRK